MLFEGELTLYQHKGLKSNHQFECGPEKEIVMTDVFRQPMKTSSLKGDWVKMSLGFAILVLNSGY